MNNKLSDWASVAEIISGLAVVITLIFLIVGIRDNTDVVRVSVYSDLIESLSGWERANYQDPALAGLSTAFFAGDLSGLTELDQRRVRNMVQNLFRIYERAYFSWRYEVIGEAEWGRFLDNMCSNAERARAIDYEIAGLATLTREYIDFLTESCAPRSQ